MNQGMVKAGANTLFPQSPTSPSSHSSFKAFVPVTTRMAASHSIVFNALFEFGSGRFIPRFQIRKHVSIRQAIPQRTNCSEQILFCAKQNKGAVNLVNDFTIHFVSTNNLAKAYELSPFSLLGVKGYSPMIMRNYWQTPIFVRSASRSGIPGANGWPGWMTPPVIRLSQSMICFRPAVNMRGH